jgi:hypothetical protein
MHASLRLALSLAVLAGPALAALAAPASAAPARMVDCKKLKGNALVKAILEGRCRATRSSRDGASAPAGSLAVKVRVKGTQRTTWTEQGESRSNVGTASECHGSSGGAGSQSVEFDTGTRSAYVSSPDGRRLVLDAALPLGGQVTREGTRQSGTSGPNCAVTQNVADASGCGKAGFPRGGYAATIRYARNTLRLGLSDFDRTSGALTPCPFSELTKYGGEFAAVKSRKIAAATLLKGRSTTLSGTVRAAEQIDCATKNGGSPCATPPDSADFRETASTTLAWTVKITR